MGSGIRTCIDRLLEDYGLKADHVIESSSNVSLIELAKKGYGLMFMPYSLVRNDIEKGLLKVIDIKDISLTRDYYLVYYKNKYLSEEIKNYMKDIIHYFHHVYNIANKK